MQELSLSRYLIPSLIFLLFCISHSLFASAGFKQALFGSAGWLKPWYRLLYNLLALILFAAWYFSLPEDQVLYRVPQPFSAMLFAFQVVTAAGTLYLFLKLSGGGLTGLSQLKQFLANGTAPNYLDEPDRGELNRSGLYNHVRHPVYTLVMLLLIASPVMSYNRIYMILTIGLYFFVGTLFEEKNLIRRFGEEYRAYQKEVPRFLPSLFFRRRK